jgi:5-carboxymethyl-2-hydroxymuconate isomerase
MPHLRLEYTDNIGAAIQLTDLFAQLHDAISETAGIAIESCKSRAYRPEDYWIGRGEPDNAFVHLEVQVLEGKTLELKQALGRQCLSLLRSHFGAAPPELDLQITIEIRDMPPEVYFKDSQPR